MENTVSFRFYKTNMITILLLWTLSISCSMAQSKPMGYCENPKFDKEVAKYISQTVPVISVEQLRSFKDQGSPLVILDTREPREYAISHIPGAINVGYDEFDMKNVPDIPKDAKVVVYCSIGYRSEKIGERLQSNGISHVNNLYGSIFEWANKGYPLEDATGKSTQKIHTYNKAWSKWVDENQSEKVW